MHTMTYATEGAVVEVHFDHALIGVFARRREDGRWEAYQVQYQPESWRLGQAMRYAAAPALFHPVTGEKLVAVRNSNSFYAIVEAASPEEALAAFEEAFQEALEEN